MNDFHYSQLLQEELSRRSAKNSGYSLRAFARDLEIAPAQLSRVLRRKQNISLQMARSVSPKLFRSKKKQDLFMNMVSLALTRNQKQAELLLEKIQKGRVAAKLLQHTWLDVIAEWYHIAILDLLTLPNAPQNAAEIATALGISVAETQMALTRLRSLGLVRNEGARIVKAEKQMETPDGIPSAAIRKYHRQMISKSLASLERQSVDERYIVGRTMTIRRADLPRLRQLVQDFLEQATEITQEESCDSLYQINLQVFDLLTQRRRVS